MFRHTDLNFQVLPRASLEHAHILANHRREKERKEQLKRGSMVDVELQIHLDVGNKVAYRTDRDDC